jgi:hypothetical protein
MTPAVFLFILRLLSAALLIAFLAAIAWLILQDLRATRAALADRRRHFGSLKLIRLDGEGPDVERLFPLAPVTSIGRAASNTIVLEDDYVSNEHALLMLRGQQWWLEDLNSRNGTLLNGNRLLEPTVISPGDVITIGNTQLKIEFAA